MTDNGWRTMHPACEICNAAPASEIQGGIVNDKRGVWFCCRACKQRIKDERKGYARAEEMK